MGDAHKIPANQLGKSKNVCPMRNMVIPEGSARRGSSSTFRIFNVTPRDDFLGSSTLGRKTCIKGGLVNQVLKCSGLSVALACLRPSRPPTRKDTLTIFVLTNTHINLNLQVMATQGDLEQAGPGPSIGVMDATTTDTHSHSKLLLNVWLHHGSGTTRQTTFLTSIDGQLFTLTSSTPSPVTLNASKESEELVYACFAGALVFHVCSSILGYAASFLAIRYDVVDAESPSVAKNDEPDKRSDTGVHRIHGQQLLLRAIPPLYAVQSLFQIPSNTRLRLHSRTSTSPLDLLTRCYYTILALSGAGFILALLGIATYAWFGLQRVVGIFTIACLGVGLFSCVCAVVY
ncbi:hypothetical protein BDR07DRAFT_1395548 [Suillus spraguei]|nr:hypothetical protein BDR07DRAFT_1395548 [Suillus spraguei]